MLTPRPFRRIVCSVLTGTVLALAAAAQAQFSDNFNSGTLNGWATSVSSNYPATISFVPDAYGGQAVRLRAVSSALEQYGGLQNTPRVMLWETNRLFWTNFYVSVDLVGWNATSDRATNDAVVGLVVPLIPFSPLGFSDPNAPVGQPDCIIFGTRYNANGGTGGGTRGQLNMYWIVGGQVGGPIAQGDYTITPGHTYRLVFMGTNEPSTGHQFMFGYVYDVQDLTSPLVTLLGSDGPLYFYPYTYMPGGMLYGDSGGYAGLAALGYRSPESTSSDYLTTNRTVDVTFDNFVALASPPPSVSFPGTPFGDPGFPQVINRVPASFSNFYSPAGGITFNATTLSTTSTIAASDIHLYLNGVDCTSGLVITGQATNRSVSFSGLTSNVVYDARIELKDSLGRKTTNVWTFDTFTDAFLASSRCKIIECEDYDFGGGQFIDNPTPSGFTSVDTDIQKFYTGFNTNAANPTPPPPPNNTIWTNAINSSSGYVNRLGTNGVDFFEFDSLGNCPPFLNRRAGENQYRQVDPVGTTQGNLEYEYGFWVGGSAQHLYLFLHDTQRQKYANVISNLLEYCAERTEGGEWLNYTRIFGGTNYYNVYLRYGCGLSQSVSLDRIRAGVATNNLGVFSCASAFCKGNYKYAPLVLAPTVPPGNLIANGDFTANASSFIAWPGYVGGSNPSSIPNWTDLFSFGGNGINGARTSVGYTFSPADSGGRTLAFLQGGDTGGQHVLAQNLTGLAPNTTYRLMYSVGSRAGNTSRYRVVIYSDSTYTTAYYDSGVQPASTAGFVTVTATFTTPATLGSAPNIQLGNWSIAGDNTVAFANIILQPASSPAPPSGQLAVVNLSGTNTLRLTVAGPQADATKQGLSLNYLAFVPAMLVESSSQVNSGYAIDANAAVEPGSRTITIPQSGDQRFYRLRGDHAAKITGMSFSGGNVILSYE